MKSSTTIWVIVVILVIVGLGWWWVAKAPAPAAEQNSTTSTQSDQGMPNTGVTTGAPQSATVTYGPGGFSPSSITIAKGGTITWVAAPGADELWVASNPHPTHEGYDGTTKDQHCAVGYSGPAPLDQCVTGTTYSFTFNRVGTWGYHNHGNHNDTGTVVVQ